MFSLKEKVKYCLEKYEDARNNDKKLINSVYVEFYNNLLFRTDDNKYAVKLVDMYELPNPSHIVRWRQKFNQNNEYIPTDEKVREIRSKEEKKWHIQFSPSNPSLG